MALRAVIYDLDGTLIDSRRDLVDAVNHTLARLGFLELPAPLVASFVGEGAELLVRRALSAARRRHGSGDEAPAEIAAAIVEEAMPLWRESYGARLLATTRPYPGVVALLQEAPAQRGVLTNKPGGFARAILEGLGLAASFARVVGGDEAPRKPRPDGLLLLCAALGVSPAEALLVGDSPVDIGCARAAGVPSCGVTWGFAARADLLAAGPDFACDDVAEVAALLGRLR